jgi:tungstate transport system ATP-binding protein
MTLLQIDNLSFSYSKCDDFTLSIPHFELNQGERVALIGPNGAGKTTLLQLIALLQKHTKGTIVFNGKELRSREDILNYHRQTAFVPQRPVMYNRSVLDNVAIGLMIRNTKPVEIGERVMGMLKALKIAHLANRNALSISGGEARRVMLARALVLNPKILFLDEPFADLDEPVRRSIIEDTLPILSESGCATIFVTHNQDETYQLANRFMVLIKGQIIQSGTAYEIFGNPATKEVAEFIGIRNIIPAEVVGENEGMFQLRLNQGIHLWYSPTDAGAGRQKGNQVLCCIPPESITVAIDGAPSHASARNSLKGIIKKVIPSRYLVWLEIECSGVSLTASVTHQSVKELGLIVGKPVSVLLKATAIQVLER